LQPSDDVCRHIREHVWVLGNEDKAMSRPGYYYCWAPIRYHFKFEL